MKRMMQLLLLSMLPVMAAAQVFETAPMLSIPPAVESVYGTAVSEAPANPASTSTVALKYFTQSQNVFDWQCPRNYGAFINLYMFQRYTLPNNMAFLDSIRVYVTNITSGAILIRVREDTLIGFTGGSFHFPKSLASPAIDSVMVDKSQLTMGAFNTIKMNGRLVPKEFFISIEFTFSGGQNNTIAIRGDSHQKSARSTAESRLVMLNQLSGGNLTFTILDSALVESTSQQPIYSHFMMTAYCDTATSQGVPLFDSQPKVKGFVGQLYQYAAHAAGVPRPTYAVIQGPNGLTVNAVSGVVSWTPGAGDAGVHQVKLRASNSNGSGDQTYAITVGEASAPKITSVARKTAIVGEPYFYQVTATGGPEPTFLIATGPQGMTIDAESGLVTMTPVAGQGGNIYIVGIVARNALGQDTQSYSLKIDNTASAPQITSTPKTTGSTGLLYTYQVDATGNPQPTYTLTKAPTGMTVNTLSGLIEWPSPPDGAHDVTVRAENRVGFNEQSFTVTIAPGQVLPVFTSSPLTDATADVQYSYTAIATGAPTPKYFLTVSSEGMTIDSITGILRWMPTRAQRGSHPVTIQAVNAAGSTNQSYFIHVRATPRFTSSPIFTAQATKLYLYQAVAEAEPNAAFSLTQSPAGMAVDQQSGLVSWTPTMQQIGQHQVTLVATNEIGSVQQPFTVDVSQPTAVDPVSSAGGFSLFQNYPNPISIGGGSTLSTVDFIVPDASHVVLEVRNSAGQRVGLLVDERLHAGRHSIAFDPVDSALPAGVYFLVLRAQGVTLTRPMTIVK